ncbi:LptF/LptG family permease [Candidatus Magnetomonas plexicatena]|uniref:LptF/LptG family permease n=1 Tax=Candidatus Magnetomonas plexicatena TaxID=2552947 RepID=UPI001C746DBD|nr:YjgP/YjgQ family permease [Nitrospirales bacterium LBB_01]
MELKVKLIEKYIVRELFNNFVLSLLAFNMVLMMERILKFSILLSGVGATLLDFAGIIVLIQPQLFLLTIPMSLMSAVLFTYGRLTSDNELTILRSSGMSFVSISRPVFALGILCFILSIFNSFYLGPETAKELRIKITELITTKSPRAIREGNFYSLFKDVVILVKKKPTEDTLNEIFIYDKRDPTRPGTIFAKEGKISVYGGTKIGFNLKEGEIYLPDQTDITKITFDNYNMILTMTHQVNSQISELTPFEVLSRAKETKGDERVQVFLEFHRRLALPLIVLILSALAPSISLLSKKTGRLGELSLAMVVFLLYYSSLIYFEKLARTGKLPHYVSGWLPLTALLIFTSIFFIKATRR